MKEKASYPIIGQDALPLYADFIQASKVDAEVLRDMSRRIGTTKQLVSCKIAWEETFKDRLTQAREAGLLFLVSGAQVTHPKKSNFLMRGINAYFGTEPKKKYRDLNPVSETFRNFDNSLNEECEKVRLNTDHNPSIIEEGSIIVLPVLEAIAKLWPKSIVHCDINGYGNEYNAMQKLMMHTDSYACDTKQEEEQKMRAEWGDRKGVYINLAVNGDGMPVENPVTKEIGQCSSYTWNMFTTHGHPQGPLKHSTPAVRQGQTSRRTLSLIKVYPTPEEWEQTIG